MGIFRQPPPPFIGGTGPLLPRRLPPSELAVPVNDPPIRSGLRNVALLAIVVASWQPVALGAPQARRFVPQPAADTPPFSSRTALPTIRAAWEPAPPAPQVTKKIPPSILAVPVDDPPFTSRTSLPTILEAWQPGALPPPLRRFVPEGVVVDNPPFGQRLWVPIVLRAWEPPDPLPWQGWKVNPAIEAVPVDDPPIGRRLWLSTILTTWQPGPPHRQAQRFLVPPAVVVGDDPPRDPRRWLPTILEAWQPPPPLPWMGWKVNPAIEAVPVDDPPFAVRRHLSILQTILRAWEPVVQPFHAPPTVIVERLVHRIPVMHCFPWQLQILAQQTTPPGAPATGERYVVTSVATGLWAGRETAIAWYDGSSWQFDLPDEGWATYDLGVSTMLFFDGAAWVTWTIP